MAYMHICILFYPGNTKLRYYAPRSTLLHSATRRHVLSHYHTNALRVNNNRLIFREWITLDLSSARDFLHTVQGGAGFEPTDLLLVQRVIQSDGVHFAILVLDLRLHWLQG